MSLGFFALLAAVVVFGLFLSVWLITFLVDDASLFDLIWGGTFYATGKANDEKKMSRRRAYADYVRRTSGFVPMPPRSVGDDSGG